MRNGLTFFALILVSVTSISQTSGAQTPSETPLDLVLMDETTPIAGWLPDFDSDRSASVKPVQGCQLMVKLHSDLVLRPQERYVRTNRDNHAIEGTTRTEKTPDFDSGPPSCRMSLRNSKLERTAQARAAIKIYPKNFTFQLNLKAEDTWIRSMVSERSTTTFYNLSESNDMKLTCKKENDGLPLTFGELARALSPLADIYLVCPTLGR